MFLGNSFKISTFLLLIFSSYLTASHSLYIPGFGTLDLAACPRNAETKKTTWLKCFNAKQVSVIQVVKTNAGPNAPRALFNGALLEKGDPLLIAQHNIRVTNTKPITFECYDSFFPHSPLNAAAPVFIPSSSFHHTVTPSPVFQAASFPSFYPTPSAPPLPAPLAQVLSFRKAALIEGIQREKAPESKRHTLGTIERQWNEILRTSCDLCNYPFSALDLSFPTPQEVATTPKVIPYTTEGAIKEMEEELALDSTAEAKKVKLRQNIEILQQFLVDIKKPHPFAFDGILTRSKVQQDLPEAPASSHDTSVQFSPELPSSFVPASTAVASVAELSQPASVENNLPNSASPSIASDPSVRPSSFQRNIASSLLPPVTPVASSSASNQAAPSSSPKHRQRKTPKSLKAAVAPIAPAKKESKEEFLAACLSAVTAATPSVPRQQGNENSTSTLSKFTQKAQAAEAYRLAKVKREQVKIVAAAIKIKEAQEKAEREKTYYALIKTACNKQEYETALAILVVCDTTTEQYGEALFAITQSMVHHNTHTCFHQLESTITTLITQKKPALSPARASYFLLYLFSQSSGEIKRSYLQKAAALNDPIAQVQLAVVEIKEQLENPHAKKCKEKESCIHKKAARLLSRLGNNPELKYLSATYLLSILCLKSGCPNIEMPTSLDTLYATAERYLSPEEYAYLLEIHSPTRQYDTPAHPRIVTVPSSATSTSSGLIDLNALLATAMGQASASLPNSASPFLIRSPNGFFPVLYATFEGFDTITQEFEEKTRKAQGVRKKAVQTLVTRKKESLRAPLITLLKSVKNTGEVEEFMTSLEHFERHPSYQEVRMIIDSYLQTSSPTIQAVWRPYRVLPHTGMFPSLAPCTAPHSFIIRCKAFHTELDTYLATAPKEKEVFKGIEKMITTFLKTSNSPVDIEHFLHAFMASNHFCLCLGAVFHHLKQPNNKTFLELATRFKNDLARRITQLKTQHPSPSLIEYLEETLSEIKMFVENAPSLEAQVTALSPAPRPSLTFPSVTEYANPTTNKFLTIIPELLKQPNSKQTTIDALFHRMTILTHAEAPYFMYALGTRAEHLLPDLQTKVEKSDSFDSALKHALVTGFKTLQK